MLLATGRLSMLMAAVACEDAAEAVLGLAGSRFFAAGLAIGAAAVLQHPCCSHVEAR